MYSEILYYMHICANTLAFVHGFESERLYLLLLLSPESDHTHKHTNTHKSDVSVRITALLHTHSLTDDGMHLVLQTGSTAYM